MRFHDAGVESNGRCAPSLETRTGLATGRTGPWGRTFASLSQTRLATRFLSWEGLSGKSYVFSVYAASDCPAFCEAVLLAAARGDDGCRGVLAVVDTGAFPEPTLARLHRDLRRGADDLEFHLHLLAVSQSERRDAIADLAGRLIRGGTDSPLYRADGSAQNPPQVLEISRNRPGMRPKVASARR